MKNKKNITINDLDFTVSTNVAKHNHIKKIMQYKKELKELVAQMDDVFPDSKGDGVFERYDVKNGLYKLESSFNSLADQIANTMGLINSELVLAERTLDLDSQSNSDDLLSLILISHMSSNGIEPNMVDDESFDEIKQTFKTHMNNHIMSNLRDILGYNPE